jgi:hypothetical protein
MMSDPSSLLEQVLEFRARLTSQQPVGDSADGVYTLLTNAQGDNRANNEPGCGASGDAEGKNNVALETQGSILPSLLNVDHRARSRPHLLEVVIVALLRPEDVNDNVAVV